MKIEKQHLQLDRREITAFLHNAQLGAAELVDAEVIPALHTYKNNFVKLFAGSSFSRTELIFVLVSAAWDLWQKETARENPTVGR